MYVWQGRLSVLLCPREPVGQFGPAAWGTWVRQKVISPRCWSRNRANPPRGTIGYLWPRQRTRTSAEASAGLTQRCLAVLRSHPIAWLVVQTRSLLVQRDFALLAQLPFVTLNVSIETDLPEVYRRFTRSSAAPERRLTLVRLALARGIFTQMTVSPLLPSSAYFAETLVHAVGEKGRTCDCRYVPRRDGRGPVFRPPGHGCITR